jgi:2-phosphosulfolactate phosphatase
MRFKRVSLANCKEATGTVVAVDVIRAFTSAAYAFAGGAEAIVLTGEVEEALALGRSIPGALVMGEDGLKPEGFDLGNSPAEVGRFDLAGRRLVQRTSAGTQGVVCSYDRADVLLTCSLVCAKATARYILELAPEAVTFVITGIGVGVVGNDGEEDMACADYVQALLQGENPPTELVVQRVLDSDVARHLFLNPGQPAYSPDDLPYCTAINRFDFAMRVKREDGLLVMRPTSRPLQ